MHSSWHVLVLRLLPAALHTAVKRGPSSGRTMKLRGCRSGWEVRVCRASWYACTTDGRPNTLKRSCRQRDIKGLVSK